MRSKKSNDNSTKKVVEDKKTSDTTPKKFPEKKSPENIAKRTPESLPKITQTEVASTSQPSTTGPKNVVDKSEI